jgi:1-aminocyclopropane-1-carboxylate synthase
MKQFLSERGKALVKDMSPLMHADFSTRDKLYDPETNPDGYINMGTAETHLINREVIELLSKIQNRMELLPKHIHYDFFHGSIEFRDAIANYWQSLIFGKNSDRKLTRENISVGTGCSLALEKLAVMLGDPGDVFLIPTPYYSGFEDDINHRAGIIPKGVHCGTDLPKAAFEAAFGEQTKQGRKVRAVLFSSPNNPVGTVYQPEAIQNLISFCMQHDIDLIADEIYGQTIHDPAAEWVSALRLVPDEYLHRVHVTSSFAKDFALSGLRTGFVISFNSDMMKGMTGLSYFSAVSTHTQAVLTELLKAPETPAIVQRNKEQLRAGYELMKKSLNDMGIETLPAQGGIFIFADFSDFMEKEEFSEEFVLWEKIFGELKVNISPGQLFDAPRPGWFRICYAQNPAIVAEACNRLRRLKKLR